MKRFECPTCPSPSATSPTSCAPGALCSFRDALPRTRRGAPSAATTPRPRLGRSTKNLKRCLAAAGATFADVCKVTVFLKNIADREKVNVARKEYFGPHRPASTLVEISRLVRDDLLVEIEAIAVLPE